MLVACWYDIAERKGQFVLGDTTFSYKISQVPNGY